MSDAVMVPRGREWYCGMETNGERAGQMGLWLRYDNADDCKAAMQAMFAHEGYAAPPPPSVSTGSWPQEALPTEPSLPTVLALLEDARSMMRIVSDGFEDEGDRTYLGSTNHADWLRAKAEKIEAYFIANGIEPADAGNGQGSRPQEAVPTEGPDAAVLDRIHWLCEGAQPSDYAVVLAAIREAAAPVDHMVQRFLSWRLPEDFNPDNGISFKPTFNDHMDPPMRCNPTGTNLFDARQAEAMVRHMLAGEAS